MKTKTESSVDGAHTEGQMQGVAAVAGWFASLFRRKQPSLLTPEEIFSRLFRVLKIKDGTALGAVQAKRISELYREDWERCRDVCQMIRDDEAEMKANK